MIFNFNNEENRRADSDMNRLVQMLGNPPVELSVAPTQANFLKVLPNHMDAGIISNTLYINYFGDLYSQPLTLVP